MRRRFIISIVFLCLNAAHAQQMRQSPPEVRTQPSASAAYAEQDSAALQMVVGRFFQRLQKREFDEAYAQLTEHSALAEKTAEMESLKQQTEKAVELFGAVVGSELIREEPVAARLVRLTYLSYGEKYPLRWRFYFYKPTDTWRLIDIRVDDNLVRMFDDETDESQ